jgi:hypothetical protein
MTTKELIEILKTYPLDTTVSVAHHDRGCTLSEVEMVAPNNGPSIYVVGWDRNPKPHMIHAVTESLTKMGIHLTEEQAQGVAEVLDTEYQRP